MSDERTIKSLYTDGACIGNPGPGGWGVLVNFNDDSIHEMGGAQEQTTNNRMELQAAIAALRLVTSTGQTEPVTLYTDSEYVRKGITSWIASWKRNGWRTSQGKPVLNQDLWEMLAKLNSQQVKWKHVKGHSGNPGNERCDAIARAFASGQQPSLQQAAANPLALEESNNPKLESSQVSLDRPADGPKNRAMNDLPMPEEPAADSLPREIRVAQLRNLIETLQIADEIASKGYLIASSELADLMDINASAVTSRGDHWVWRNWVVSRVRREGYQILWQLERVD
ncbi:MAG: ribonuclease HI [Hormoscilla sp. GM7CHS1pb]|nr:ribonuclease HI [Hormoscilla sp. GM7CHS1pb]